MRVTVCELRDTLPGLAQDWSALVAHAKSERSDLVLLPEMPFCPWFGVASAFDAHVWQAAVAAHDAWQARLAELAPAIVLGSRPVNRGTQRLNEAFRWTLDAGCHAAHHKCHLPNEDGFWEAEWYERGDGSFSPVRCGAALVGFEICTELWALEQARTYGKAGVHIIVTPRATPISTLDKWVVGGRATAVCSGAFSLSSNHVSTNADPVHLGGRGWIIAPDGDVIGVTSSSEPMITAELDLALADAAKHTYPRYVF